MKIFISAFILLTVLSSCALRRLPQGLSLGNSGATHGEAKAAFEAQKVDVDFVAAWSRFQRQDRAGSSRYLEKAARTMRQQGLDSSLIRNFALRVKDERRVTEREFENVFATAHRSMAQFHRVRVDSFLAEHQEEEAGASMEALAYHTERGAQWSGEELSSSQQQEISNLRRVGGALRSGTGYLVKGSGYLVKSTGWVLGKGFNLLTHKGDETSGRTGSVLRGTGRGGETGSRWIRQFGAGIGRAGDWILRR